MAGSCKHQDKGKSGVCGILSGFRGNEAQNPLKERPRTPRTIFCCKSLILKTLADGFSVNRATFDSICKTSAQMFCQTGTEKEKEVWPHRLLLIVLDEEAE